MCDRRRRRGRFHCLVPDGLFLPGCPSPKIHPWSAHLPSGDEDDRLVDAWFYATTPVMLNLPGDAMPAETLETDCLNGALEFE
jgi:hypothetical protein